MNTIKILVIDSDADIRKQIEESLQGFTIGFPFLEEDFDFSITQASTGAQGLQIINNQEVDLLLLANRLPDMAGMDILDYINKDRLEISVTIIASHACREFAMDATNKGASGFILKPFKALEIQTSVDSSTKQLYLKRMTQQMTSHGRKLRYKFLSVLSHELKSPLNAIEGYLQLMDDRMNGESIKDYDKMIKRSIDRISGMRSLIMDLLDLTQLERTQENKTSFEINISKLFVTAIDTIRPIAIQKNLKVIKTIEPKIFLLANPYEIEIIFNNVLSNAVKYNKDSGRIFVTLQTKNNNVELIVEDTGIGIAKEDMGKLFHSFSRIKNKHTRGISGSGLGLSILKQTVKSLGGSIDIKSEVGKGSIFTISLPHKTTINQAI